VGFDVVRYPLGSWHALLAQARELEEAGAGSLWLADHPERTGVLEPWTALAALAGSTDRIRLGTAATNASQRNPVVLAAQVAAVNEISGGRVQLAIGAGDGGKVEAIERALDAIEGVPVYVAANARRGLELAAARGVGSLTQGDERGLEGVRERNAYLDELGASGERLYFVGWSDEHPFVSEEALVDFVGRYREVGVTRFLFAYAAMAKQGRFLTREALDIFGPLLAHLASNDDEEEVRDT
jgi:alkanesulfonate monooxygenase SsuD/methylene tetrahydromethanopterin reductase-like flavin-dependent oxidoreductase (luciferase family)